MRSGPWVKNSQERPSLVADLGQNFASKLVAIGLDTNRIRKNTGWLQNSGAILAKRFCGSTSGEELVKLTHHNLGRSPIKLFPVKRIHY